MAYAVEIAHVCTCTLPRTQTSQAKGGAGSAGHFGPGKSTCTCKLTRVLECARTGPGACRRDDSPAFERPAVQMEASGHADVD
jgi:hypothetical protein